MKNASAAVHTDTTETINSTNLIVIKGNGNGEPPAPPRLPVSKADIVQMPFSPGTQLVDDILMAGTAERIILMSRRRKQQLGCKVTLQMGNNSLRLTNEKNDNLSVIEVTDMQTLVLGHEAARKVFGFLRMKLNQGTIINGELIHNELTFPLSDLVDAGLYSAVTSARRGFNAAMPALLALKMRFQLGCRHVAMTQEEALVPFTSAWIKGGICHVRLNEDFCWQTFFAFYAPTPKWAFGLSLPQQALMLYLHEIARQHSESIEKGEAVSIKLETLRCKLCLPENTHRHGCRDTLGGILRAIEAIEARQSEYINSNDSGAAEKAREKWFGEIPGLCFGFDPSEEPGTMKEFARTRLTFTIGGAVRTMLSDFCERKRRKTAKREQREADRQSAINQIIAERTVKKQEKSDMAGQTAKTSEPASESKGSPVKRRGRMKA